MSYKLLNQYFYPDITNIILDYIMISRHEVIKQKNFTQFYLCGKMMLASMNPNNSYIDNVNKFHEFEKMNKKIYKMMKHDKTKKDIRTWL
jgi:hypothetical protein